MCPSFFTFTSGLKKNKVYPIVTWTPRVVETLKDFHVFIYLKWGILDITFLNGHGFFFLVLCYLLHSKHVKTFLHVLSIANHLSEPLCVNVVNISAEHQHVGIVTVSMFAFLVCSSAVP